MNQPEDAEPQLDLRASRDKYVQDNLREMVYSMKDTEIPKGVIFSQVLLTMPLLFYTGNLCMLSPMLDSGMVDPARFAYLARTSLRLLGLNIAFNGGIHYGLGSAFYETVESED